MVNFNPSSPQGVPTTGAGEISRPTLSPTSETSLSPIGALSLEARIDRLFDLFREKEEVNGQLDVVNDEISQVLDDLEALRDENNIELKRALSELKEKRNELQGVVNKLQTTLKEEEKKLLSEVNSRIGFDFVKKLPVTLSKISGATEEDLLFFRELQLNKLANLENYGLEVKNFVQNHQGKLLEEFDSLGTIKKSSSVRFSLSMLGEETHHQGRAPVLITFNTPQDDELNIVFKPRDAKMDRSILELFKALNESSDPSEVARLPEYKIWEPDNGEISVWQYIKGKSLTANAEDSLEKLKEGKQAKARKNLERLEAVCQLAGITDLHMENVIRQKDQWIPIDLEVIERGVPTGLYGRGTINPDDVLSERDKEIIDQFIQRREELPFRSLVLSTTELAEAYSGAGQIDKVANTLSKALKNKYIDLCNEEKLRQLLEKDVKNHDVPFFAFYQQFIYYGKVSEGNIIARRKTNVHS